MTIVKKKLVSTIVKKSLPTIKIKYAEEDKEDIDRFFQDRELEESIILEVLIDNTYTSFLEINSTVISCGVCQLSNILGLKSVYNELRRKRIPVDICKSLIVEAIKKFVKEDEHFAFLICSTYVDNLVCEIMDICCEGSTSERFNRNSGNQIRVWVI